MFRVWLVVVVRNSFPSLIGNRAKLSERATSILTRSSIQTVVSGSLTLFAGANWVLIVPSGDSAVLHLGAISSSTGSSHLRLRVLLTELDSTCIGEQSCDNKRIFHF